MHYFKFYKENTYQLTQKQLYFDIPLDRYVMFDTFTEAKYN